MQFSHLYSSETTYPNSTKFATEMPPNYANLHTKFKANRTSQSQDTLYEQAKFQNNFLVFFYLFIFVAFLHTSHFRP